MAEPATSLKRGADSHRHRLSAIAAATAPHHAEKRLVRRAIALARGISVAPTR